MQANQPEEMRGYPGSVLLFMLIDLVQRLLGQMLFWVTRATVNEVDLRLSARESVGKRKNERVFKLRFFLFCSVSLTYDPWVNFFSRNASYG